MKALVIDYNCFNGCLKRLHNWAVLGPDGVQGFWIKTFSNLHSVFMFHYSAMLHNGSKIPVWFPIGQTIIYYYFPTESSDTILYLKSSEQLLV